MSSKEELSFDVIVVQGDNVLVNKTVFFDEKYGTPQGALENMGRPFDDVSSAPDFGDEGGWVMKFAPGTYVFPEDFSKEVSIVGSAPDAVFIYLNGQNNVYVEGVTVVSEENLLTLQGNHKFFNCNIRTRMALESGVEAHLSSCDIDINAGALPCLTAPVLAVPSDPYILPFQIQGSTIKLVGGELFRGVSIKGGEIISLTSVADVSAIIFSSLAECTSGPIVGMGNIVVQGSVISNSHISLIRGASVSTKNSPQSNLGKQWDAPIQKRPLGATNGSTCIHQCNLGNNTIDVIQAGNGTDSGGHCMAYTNINNCYFLAVVSGEGGGGSVFYNCFNMSDNYIEFYCRVGEGGALIAATDNDVTMVNLNCDTLTEVGDFGAVVRNRNQSLLVNTLRFRVLTVGEQGHLLDHVGAIPSSLINYKIEDFTLFSEEGTSLFYGEADESLSSTPSLDRLITRKKNAVGEPITLTILAIIGLVSAGITLATTLIEKYGSRKLKGIADIGPHHSVFKVSKLGDVSSPVGIQGTVDQLVIGNLSSGDNTVLETDTENSLVKSNGVVVNNVLSSRFSLAGAYNGGFNTANNCVLQGGSIQVMPDPPVLMEKYLKKVSSVLATKVATAPEKFSAILALERLHHHHLLDDHRLTLESPLTLPLQRRFLSHERESKLYSRVMLPTTETVYASIFDAGAGGDLVINGATVTGLRGGPLTMTRSLNLAASKLGLPGTTRLRAANLTATDMDLTAPLTSPLQKNQNKKISLEERMRRDFSPLRATVPFAYHETRGDSESFISNSSVENVRVASGVEFNFNESDEGGVCQYGTSQIRLFDMLATPLTSRFVKTIGGAVSVFAHSNCQQIETPSVAQLETEVGAVTEIRNVHVDNNENPVGTGNYTVMTNSTWSGTTA